MKCVTSSGLYTITARPRPPLVRPGAQLVRHVKRGPPEHHSGHPYTRRFTHHCKRLQMSRLPITKYNTRHMEWGFYSVKPATGGEGVRPGYTTATTTHNPPQIFLRQLAPFRACTSPSPCYIPLRPPRHLPAVRSGWPSPLHRRKCSGLSLSPPCTLHWCGVPSLVL